MQVALDDVARWPALAAGLADALGAAELAIHSARRLDALGEAWRVEADVIAGGQAMRRGLVLRMAAPASDPLALDLEAEAQVVRHLAAAGVPVADVVGPVPTAGIVPAFLLQPLQDEAVAHDIAALAEGIARAHALAPGGMALACLPVPMTQPGRCEVAHLRAALDHAAEKRPALEYVLAWLDRFAPPLGPLGLVHGRLAGDSLPLGSWQHAHWGDPDEDVGYLLALLSGPPREAAAATFLSVYERASGRRIEPARLAYWRIMGHACAAVFAALEGADARTGRRPTLAAALAGRRSVYAEHAALSAALSFGTENEGPKWP